MQRPKTEFRNQIKASKPHSPIKNVGFTRKGYQDEAIKVNKYAMMSKTLFCLGGDKSQ